MFITSENCPNTEQISVFSPNTGKYGPEKTPFWDTFHAVYLVSFSVNIILFIQVIKPIGMVTNVYGDHSVGVYVHL